MSGSVTEDLSLTAHGTLTITDPDTGESSFQAVATIEGQYGSLDIDSGGSFGRTVYNNLYSHLLRVLTITLIDVITIG